MPPIKAEFKPCDGNVHAPLYWTGLG